MRLLRERGAGIDKDKSYLLVSVDNSGLDFLIVRRGGLYFEYRNRWADLMDDKGQITVEKFEESLVANLRQVINFYEQHWPEPLSNIVLSAAAFREETETAVKEVSAVPAIPLRLTDSPSLPPEWFSAFGSSLRPTKAGTNQINLLGEGAEDVFQEEQMLRFANFWRIVFPLALGLLLLAYGVADAFLVHIEAQVKAQMSITVPAAQLAAINQLQASATAFNQSVSLVAGIEKAIQPEYIVLADLTDHAASSGVTITHVGLQGVSAPVFLSGTADNEGSIIGFKNAIAADPRFGPVNLPLTNIQQNGGSFTFSMDFPLSASAFE